MKKRLIAFIAVAISAVSAVFSGCSCTGNDPLSFDFELPKAETLSYKVEHVVDYNESTKKNAELDNYFTFNYQVGTYKSVLKAADKSEVPYKSDILDIKEPNGEALVKTVYSLTTEFEIGLTVTIDESEKEYTERITTVAYIASFGISFAPLYAEENAEYTNIALGEKTSVSVLKSETKTFYDKEEYHTVKRAKYFAADETVTLDGVDAEETTTKYAFRSAIDNAEFLFAVRSLKIDEKAAKSINVVSSGFSAPQPVKITNTAASENDFSFNYNGNTVTEKIKYASLSYSLDKTNASGIPQYASVQTESAGQVKNTCLLLEYVKPLITYGSNFMSMGALKFTLTTVETI